MPGKIRRLYSMHYEHSNPFLYKYETHCTQTPHVRFRNRLRLSKMSWGLKPSGDWEFPGREGKVGLAWSLVVVRREKNGKRKMGWKLKPCGGGKRREEREGKGETVFISTCCFTSWKWMVAEGEDSLVSYPPDVRPAFAVFHYFFFPCVADTGWRIPSYLILLDVLLLAFNFSALLVQYLSL